MVSAGVVMIGGGLAAQRCAETLRSRGFDGAIQIVCAESRPPYDRPPLSKGLLAGSADASSLAYRPPEWYADNEVELLLESRATALDPHRHVVTLDDGTQLAYEKLLIATGGAPKGIPFLSGFENVTALRDVEEAHGLRERLRPGSRLAIVGAGFIGLEVAATARALGVEVTVIEALEVPLAPILGERVGGWFARLHAEEGVRLLTSARLESAGGGSNVNELRLADGRRIECDAAVVAVGVAPATDWLRGTVLGEGLIRTDTGGRTRLPDVFAAGDVAAAFEPRFGEHVRSEHWDAAARQGSAAAQAMLGGAPGTPPLPSFWSDQYGSRIQYVGHADRATDVLIEGDPRERDFAVLFAREGSPVAALAVGRPRAIAEMRGRIDAAYWTGPIEPAARAA